MLAGLTLPLMRCVPLGKSLHLSVPLLHRSQNEGNNTRPVEFCKSSDKAQVKGLAE